MVQVNVGMHFLNASVVFSLFLVNSLRYTWNGGTQKVGLSPFHRREPSDGTGIDWRSLETGLGNYFTCSVPFGRLTR